MSTGRGTLRRGLESAQRHGLTTTASYVLNRFVANYVATPVLRAILDRYPEVATNRPDITDLNRHVANGRTYGNVVSLYRVYQPWQDDAAFRALWEQVNDYTMNDVLRAYTLYTAVEQTRHRDGAIVEVGTHDGGLGCLLARKAADEGLDAETYLCDTFEGIVKSGEKDAEYADRALSQADPRRVRELAAELDVEPRILEGVFPDETADEIEEDVIRLAHVDVDVYQSTRDAYEWLWPKLPPGGIVVVDDAGYPKANGVTEFMEEVADNEDNVTQYRLNTQALLVKTE